MPLSPSYDAVVVGAGPNGLGAAIVLAEAGKSVLLIESKGAVGGGARSSELTLPGFVHDVCSTAYPLAAASPFLASLPLAEHGLQWAQPLAPASHPLDDGSAVTLHRSVESAAEGLGVDSQAYVDFASRGLEDWRGALPFLLSPMRGFPKRPFAATRFGLEALRSVEAVAASRFSGERARALLAGVGAHSMLPLDKTLSAASALILGIAAHAVGWPFAKGGAQSLSNALASYLVSIGGEIETGWTVESLDELPRSAAILCDVSPRQLLLLAGDRIGGKYRRRLEAYRYGAGVYKIDYALDGPIPWRAPDTALGGTVHLGGTLEEIAASEAEVWRGRVPERPFVLVAQPSLFDDTRAPAGKHVGWAYAHVPHASTVDMTERIEAQIERFAPGFRDLALARHVMSPKDMHTYNPNAIGGAINGGIQDLAQSLARPALRWNPYSTPVKGLYLCSAATPPGGGVHGMCGYHAAKSALREVF